MEEQELVKKCLRGNKKAQKRLFDLYAPQMMTICNRYANRDDQAIDMLQEGFIKVFSNLEKFSGSGSLGGWIRTVMVNNCLTILRKDKKFSFNENIEDHDEGTSSADALSQMGFQELTLLISSLPTGYRTVFNMYAVEGYSHKEIADKLEISESTSKTQYRKAKLRLQKLIQENE
ncbi:MAG: sigma-70 family RNA polymerase sigma factor [Flavobacteriales bacterium]|jgi:RNA polymerase sigma factor (sigma-70 family)|tara:strand:+ start:848 stop:1372 length:525 start_codon:yes stop_codon:yes gene_type:complete